MLQPKKLKHQKWQKGRSRRIAKKGTEIAFGSYGLKSLESKWITAKQIEAARLAIIKALKKRGKIWIRIFPQKPVTTKGVEVPMGGGKGKVSYYVFPIEPGRIVFEIEGVGEEKAKEALKKAAAKLPVKTKFIKR